MILSDDELTRYARHIVLKEFGGTGQARLKAATVAVVCANTGAAISVAPASIAYFNIASLR